MARSYAEKAQQLASKAFENEINVDETERVVSAIAGGALLLTSANLRSLHGLLATALGGAMIYRGVTGRCPFYGSLGLSTCGGESREKRRSASGSAMRQRAGVGAE